MEQVWRAMDGQIFDTEEDCESYENSLFDYKTVYMVNCNGDRVTEPNCAAVVYFSNNIETAAFIRRCKEIHEVYDGLDEMSEGWYIWDEWACEYRWIDPELLNLVNLAQSKWKAENTKEVSKQ